MSVRSLAAAAILLAATVVPSHAQAPVTGASPTVLITGRDLGLAGGATLGAAALTRMDVPLARFFADSEFHARHPGFTTAAKRASLVTETVLMITGGVVYGIARIRRDDGTADVALHTTESVAGAAMFIQVIRGALGRARPFVVDDSGGGHHADPYDFRPLRGFTSYDYRSFPSMHAMASFATATALTQEMRRRDTPHRKVISPLLYAGAAMPSLARLYLDEHWSSDIAMGIFLGVFSGQKVVQYSHDHPDNRVDHQFLKPRATLTVTHGARGFSVSVMPF
ncbi:MAG: phosphoesterase PA-phosphatase related protein [Gemmatimonadetes bacterium]|jgi:membrane-associated phospholipid phosphatase|nr:phosphoesterase PA-phosphatase related protein [Gemmatimonadota bacterium]